MQPVLRSVLDLTAACVARAPGIARVALAPLRAIDRFADSPLLRLFVGEFYATLVRVFGYGCALAALGLIAVEAVSLAGKTAVARSAAPEWIDSVRPIPAFALSIPEFSSVQYGIRRHVEGGGRKDVFTFGDESGASARIEIYRPGGELAEDTATTTSIPELRLSEPLGVRAIETKFGLVSVESYIEQGERQCLRFARPFDAPHLVISGAFCSPGFELIDRGMVACALDRLTLLSAGRDPKLAALFARAELKRSFCGQQSVFLAATPNRTDWIEAARDPRLRGRQ